MIAHSTDVELVHRIKTGDTAAFGELVRRYQGLIYGLAYNQVGSFADAQDMAQEAFVKAFRYIGRLEQPERFVVWLKAIAVNECKMWIRGKRQFVPLEDAESMPSYASLVAENWRKTERQAEVRRAVDSLPEKSRLIVDLYYLSGLSHKEIAEFLGVRTNAVAQHLHRARKQLKDLLLAELEEGYEMNKLPEGFTQEVLGRITLYPIKDGYFITADGEGDVRGITLGVQDSESQKSYITLWMKKDDLDNITLGTLPARTSELAKGRALDSCLGMLRAFDIELQQVVLRLSGDRRCRASVELTQGDKHFTVDMRPSDAMGLAVRVKAPICAEEAVIKAGNVGEDDVPAPDQNMDLRAYNEEFNKIRLRDLITNKAFEMVSIDDLIDTVRFRKDETASVLRMWLEAVPEREVTFDLEEYGPGVEMLFDLAHRRGPMELLQGDPVSGWNKQFKFLFSMLGEDARMRVVLEKDEKESGQDS